MRSLSGRKLGVRGNSLINISLFSQDHRGNVNTSPKQWLVPTSRKRALVWWLGSPASVPSAPTPTTEHPLTPTSTRTYTDPTSTWTLNPTPGLHVSEWCPRWACVAFGWNCTSAIVGTPLCCRVGFCFHWRRGRNTAGCPAWIWTEQPQEFSLWPPNLLTDRPPTLQDNTAASKIGPDNTDGKKSSQ